jgi:hypothetical protein
VPAEQVEKDASAVKISMRTLKRAKRALGVRSRKRGDVWYWELPQETREEGHSPTAGTLGPVGPLGKDAKDEPADSAYLREGGQGCQGGQGDHEPRCIHEFPDGKGCYLCDPEHPHRHKLEVRT